MCIFGIINNSLSIVIFLRKDMRTALNCMLLALSIVDIFTLISQAVMAVYFHIVTLWVEMPCLSYGWGVYSFFSRGMWFVNLGQ